MSAYRQSCASPRWAAVLWFEALDIPIRPGFRLTDWGHITSVKLPLDPGMPATVHDSGIGISLTLKTRAVRYCAQPARTS